MYERVCAREHLRLTPLHHAPSVSAAATVGAHGEIVEPFIRCRRMSIGIVATELVDVEPLERALEPTTLASIPVFLSAVLNCFSVIVPLCALNAARPGCFTSVGFTAITYHRVTGVQKASLFSADSAHQECERNSSDPLGRRRTVAASLRTLRR